MTRRLATFFLGAAMIAAQTPSSLPGDNPFRYRNLPKNATCNFKDEYEKIRDNKNDPRVAYFELAQMLQLAGPGTKPESYCFVVSQQNEDSLVTFDKQRGYFQVVHGLPDISDSVAYFAGPSGRPGVILLIDRRDQVLRNFLFRYQNGKWNDITAELLTPVLPEKSSFLIAPQYGRAVRVLHWDGTRFQPRGWLVWNGTKFEPSQAKTQPGWKCPDGFRYFEPADRAQYCK